jgi:8-oxo-dGTP diphosphatase
MLKYNISFIKRGSEILLLNREYPSWMGCWNGIGGKLDRCESPRDSMVRELYEETNIKEYELHFKGIITWTVDGSNYGGMYTYLAEVPEDFIYPTPVKVDEGILDWKKVCWIMNSNNSGIAANIPRSLNSILYDSNCYEHHFVYENGKLQNHFSTLINPLIEIDESIREAYFSRNLEGISRVK